MEQPSTKRQRTGVPSVPPPKIVSLPAPDALCDAIEVFRKLKSGHWHGEGTWLVYNLPGIDLEAFRAALLKRVLAFANDKIR